MSNVYIYTLLIRSWVLIEQRIVENGELFIHSTLLRKSRHVMVSGLNDDLGDYSSRQKEI